MKIPVSVLLALFCANISAHAQLVAAYGTDYYAYGPSGKGSLLASAALSFTGTYSPVIVDPSSQLVYQSGNFNGNTFIAITDLKTGQSTRISDNQSPEFAGFYNGTLIAAYGTSYYSYDSVLGKGALLASSSLAFTGSYAPVAVDASNGLVYQLGNFGGSTYIAITDLDTGQSSLIPESGAPEFAGFYNGKLVAAYGTAFHYFDPVSGKGALLATSALDFVGSFAPSTIDPVTGLAYQLGNWNGNVYVAVTNLATTQSYRIAEGQYPSFAGVIPEPANFAFLASAAAGLSSLVVRRRRG